MGRRNQDFKPDKVGSGILSKLYLTEKQRRTLLKWTLYTLLLVAISLLQDVILCRVTIFGAKTDLVSGSILLLCIMLPTESCAIFALISAVLFYFSGMAAGPYVIVFLTVLGIFLNIFRYSYLRKEFSSILFCAGAALFVYEILVFATGCFLGYVPGARFGAFCATAGTTLLCLPLLYPVFLSIGKIGGDSWKE